MVVERINHTEIRERMVRNLPFKTATMEAVRITSNSQPFLNYSVYSYDTLVYREVDGECTYWDGEYYSTTTRRHQALVKVTKGKKIQEWASKE